MIVGIICSAAMGQQQSNSISRVTPKPYREGQWLPSDSKVLDKWLDELINESKQKWPRKFQLMEILHPPTESEEEPLVNFKMQPRFTTLMMLQSWKAFSTNQLEI